MEKTLNIKMEKTEMCYMDKYDEVTLQIVDAIKENFSNSNKFDDETQKKITGILKNNFDIKDEQIGRSLIKDIRMFDPNSGHEFDTPLFIMPLFIIRGTIKISPETFPNYSIENKYIGYTDEGRFYRINDFTIFMRHIRKQPLIIIALFIMIYLMVILVFSIK